MRSAREPGIHRSIAISLASAGLALLCAHGAAAQYPRGAERITAAGVQDSLDVIREIDKALRRDSKNAALWYHRGMVAWALFERERYTPPIRSLDWTKLSRLADTSLRIAADLEPENSQYYLAAGRFLLATAVPYRRYGPYRIFTATLERVRNGNDRVAHAEAAIDAGRLHWKQYECAGSAMSRWRAEALFFEAQEAVPNHSRALRHFAMLLAEQGRWFELAAFARNRTESVPDNAWAWMTLGLATQRLGDGRTASAAFDSGLVRLGADERQRLDRFERVLGPDARAAYVRQSEADRARSELIYWLHTDPLWSVVGDEPRIEFWARLTYAELRWTAEETGQLGADSEFGNAYVRTGFARPTAGACRRTFPANSIPVDASPIANGPPARWGTDRREVIDSMPAQLARFRTGSDSIDVYIAALPPVNSITQRAEIDVPVRTRFWLFRDGIDGIVRESVQPSRQHAHVFVNRVEPGTYVYRAESNAGGTLIASRATAAFVAGDDLRTGFSATGFGMSDVLVATHVAPVDAPARRWTDFEVMPVVGAAPFDGQLSLLWETYDLVPRDGNAEYSVTISIRRDEPAFTSAVRIAARVAGGIVGSFREDRANDRVEFGFDRSVPHAPAVVDYITLSLGETTPGPYIVSLNVTDHATGFTLGRSQRVVVR